MARREPGTQAQWRPITGILHALAEALSTATVEQVLHADKVLREATCAL
jgi:hypothetical protein